MTNKIPSNLCPKCKGTGDILGTVCQMCSGNGKSPIFCSGCQGIYMHDQGCKSLVGDKTDDSLDLILKHYGEFKGGMYQGIAAYDESVVKHAIEALIQAECIKAKQEVFEALKEGSREQWGEKHADLWIPLRDVNELIKHMLAELDTPNKDTQS